MNTKNAVPYIIALFTFFDSLCFAAKSSESVPGATPKAIYYDLSTQTGIAVEMRRGPSPDGKQVVRRFRFSSGRPGMETPVSPPDGWIAGKKHKSYWSNKYQCEMINSVNLGALNAANQDDGDYSHKGRMPKAGYPASHGCIRLEDDDALFIYNWTETGRTRIFITGSVRTYLENSFDGYKLLAFNPDGTIKGFLRNPDGSLTEDFIRYVRAGKMDVPIRNKDGKKVQPGQGVMGFEFFDKPWEQGIPEAEFNEYMLARINTGLMKVGLTPP